MKPERWQQIEQLYHAALELDETERTRFIEEACTGDEALRGEVQSLLAYQSRAENFIESPAIEMAAALLAREQSNWEAGRKVGSYQIVSLIATGGMGEVYLAEDTRLGRRVALKVLMKESTQDRSRVRRFEQEARAASALNHPNILTVYDIEQVDGIQCIVTEFIEGETLRQQFNEDRMTLRQALDVGCQVASALTAAHEAGILHRDIKPENIMLRRDGYVKVLDFGLAKLARPHGLVDANPSGSEVKTEAGIVMGTVNYMSPEQVRGQPVDARTDIFSFGGLLYEMVTGRAPFAGATSADVIASILERQPTPLGQFIAEVPEDLEGIVSKALSKDRGERYKTTSEMLSDLKRLKQRLEFEEELQRSIDGAHESGETASRKAGRTSPAGSYPGQSRNVIDTLAVLPFVNPASERELEYFSEGIAENIITTLSRLPELRVMAWSTVSRYKSRQVDPRQVGRDLGVRAVLTGRFVQSGEGFALKLELVDSADGSHIWGESCNCTPSDLLNMEAEICREISQKLLLRLTSEERKRIAKRYTDNTEAYHAYLKGRYFWNKRTDDSVRQGIEYFKQAIESDPSYALAYAGLADCYVILGSFGIATLKPGEAYPRAREAAMRALEIDDTLAEAHASLAMSLASYYWDWPAAQREFIRGIELRPDYATAHHWYGFACLVAMGRLDEAIRELERAHTLDPLSITISSDTGLLYYLARQYDRAIDEHRKTIEMDSNFVYSYWKLGLAYEQKAMHEEAIAQFQKSISLSGRSLLPKAQLAHAYAISGRKDEALAVLEQLHELSAGNHVSEYRIAAIHAGLGEADQAFEWLERAYDERDPWLVWLDHDPVVESLRSDPRFTDLRRRLGLGGGYSQTAETVLLDSTVPVRRQARSRKKQSRKLITSLAILPLVNASEDPGMEYLSDGITESIINNLSQLPNLRVVARSTAFRYKGKESDAETAGQELGVDAVLTGRVLQVEDKLTIAMELIDVANDSHLWGERYNRNLSDIFEIEEEITREVTGKLRLRLSPNERGRIARRHTENIEAYQAYLKGRHFWNKRTVESLKKGIEFFREAIDRDPTFASAYAGLSDSYTLLVIRRALPPAEGLSKAKEAAARALEIDDLLAEAHASMAHVKLHNWEWADAGEGFKQAMMLSPGYASAHHWHSEYLMVTGRLNEAIAEVRRAQELDPLSLIINAHLSDVLYFARRYDESIEQCYKALELDPTFFLALLNLGRAYTQKGLYDKALAEIQRARELVGDSLEGAWLIAYTYAVSGRRDEARKLLDRLRDESKHRYVWSGGIAMIYTALGETDEAFLWLERAYNDHDEEIFNLRVEPMLDGLRSDPRFENLLQRMGLASLETGGNKAEPARPLTTAPPRAIAVLPFKPIDPEQHDEYLELGMADALITRLSHLRRVVIRPTSAVRRYSELDTDPVTAGRELKVESVVEGCIQRLEDRLRVTTRLVRVEDGTALWADKIDEKFTDIFAVQDSISEKVAAALALKLTGEEREGLTKHYTENTEAYHLYLKGRYYWNKRSEEGLHKGIECFRQAIEADPNYALAYAGLADCYTKLGDVGVTAIKPREAFARARAAAERALQIDDSLAEVHASLGHLAMHLLEWADAENHFKRAIELNPNYATAHQWYAYFMAFHLRFDEALHKIETALNLDPLSLAIADAVGEFLYFARCNNEAIEQFRKVLDMDAGFLPSRINLGRAYEQVARYGEAEEQFLVARQITSESIDALAALGHTFAVSGRTGAAQEVLDQLTELTRVRYVSPYDRALIHAAMGEIDASFELLEKAYEEGVEWMIYTRADPRLDPLRADPRFNDLLRRLGFRT